MTPTSIVEQYFKRNYRVVFWKDEGAQKGPKEKDWQNRVYTLDQYQEGVHRVGLILGHEVEPGKYLHDVDLDWAPGNRVAQKILSNTDFVFGRSSKHISHCFYTTDEPITSYKYDDVDGTTLIEIRGTKKDGSPGFQSMAPPSIWEDKDDHHREPLVFRRDGEPKHLEAKQLKQEVGMAAISMLLAKNLGHHGFGHDPRLAWAGFMLRLGFTKEELILMGEAMSIYCHNTEISDIKLVVETTAAKLSDPKNKTKGGPTFARFLGENGKKVLKKVYEWLGRDSEFVRTKDGVIIKDHQENITRAFELLDVKLSYNSFSDKLMINDQPMEDQQLTTLWLKLDEEYHFRPSYDFFEKMVKKTAWGNTYHPVKIYLDGLTWDGTERIETWLRDYGNIVGYDSIQDDAYLRAISRLVLVAAVRRIRQPGCKFDEMLVLESGQGKNKSSAFRALCPDPSWFSDDLPLNVKSQQLIEGTLGKWIIEAADLAGKRKAEIEQLKAMMSRQVDGPARMAYARLPVERARQFILVGSTNLGTYLMDPTGGRRFWPVKIGGFDVEGIRKVRDQLWAEAAHRESQGESIRLAEELWGVAAEHQEERREADAWESAIEELIEGTPPDTTGRKKLATSTIWEKLGIEMAYRDRNGAMRISEIMQRSGWVRTRVKQEGKTVVGYESEQVALQIGGPSGLKSGKGGTGGPDFA